MTKRCRVWSPRELSRVVLVSMLVLAGSGHANAIEPASPEVCYGSTGMTDGGRLITIDPFTGVGTLVGPTGLDGMPGLAIDSQGQIYGTERVSGDLYRVDAATGEATRVGPTGLDFLDAIAFDENDVLYGIGFDPPDFTLHVIDPQSGATTPVGPTGDDMAGMAFDPTDGELYVSTGGFGPVVGDAIYRVDKATGAATLVGTTGFGGATSDLHFDTAGNLYGSKPGPADSDLILIDKSTGAGTLVGAIGFASVSGLASFGAAAIEVVVEIKGGEGRTPINLESNGKIPVTILGSENFDVDEIDVTTLAFGPAGAPPAHRQGGHRKKANGDKIADLLSHYETQETGIVPGQTEACVTGELFDGTPFEGCDSIQTIPACGIGFELVLVLPGLMWLRRRRPGWLADGR